MGAAPRKLGTRMQLLTRLSQDVRAEVEPSLNPDKNPSVPETDANAQAIAGNRSTPDEVYTGSTFEASPMRRAISESQLGSEMLCQPGGYVKTFLREQVQVR